MTKQLMRDWIVLAVFVTAAVALLLFHRAPGQAASSGHTVQIEAAAGRQTGGIAQAAASRAAVPAPDFTLEALDGTSYSLAQFRGKPVVLNFWASWCGPCRQEAPALVKTAADYGDRIVVLAVNLTASDDESSARAFAARQRFEFPVLLDRLGTVGELYRIRPIPTTYFIDARGVIAGEALGSLGEQEFRQRIEALLPTAD
ncbi:TlpA family protein disulfide reductase [Cohnella sp. 56]|uniref:TlpA family protein disulfide reductase n=1 Tax=Cohnella sp. 56 TaxID=3113722 RepID=UPI0030EA9A2D